MNVETNIGKRFLKLVKKHFPRNNFRIIFNKNTIKISYSCMRNISSIIASHNKYILRPKATEYNCSCIEGKGIMSLTESVFNTKGSL